MVFSSPSCLVWVGHVPQARSARNSAFLAAFALPCVGCSSRVCVVLLLPAGKAGPNTSAEVPLGLLPGAPLLMYM